MEPVVLWPRGTELSNTSWLDVALPFEFDPV
jgi:hypothetical protein